MLVCRQILKFPLPIKIDESTNVKLKELKYCWLGHIPHYPLPLNSIVDSYVYYELTAKAPPAICGLDRALAAALAAPGAELPLVNIRGAFTPSKPNLPVPVKQFYLMQFENLGN